ncbi:MAG: hypothetical protein HY763_10465 [Planctomycetes bacterium]|nr:hypothetical protein [Planctomycetota bacterium]
MGVTWAGVGLVALVLASSSSSARANVVLDFEALGHNKAVSPFSTYYSEDGFQLESSAFASWGSSTKNYAGSTALFAFFDSDVTTLSQTKGATFDLFSIDLSEAFSSGGYVPVTFIGTKVDGSQVQDSFSLDGAFGFQTHAFRGFTDLVSVQWSQEEQYHQFDNLKLGPATVPIPGAWALGVVGLALAGFAQRRFRP